MLLPQFLRYVRERCGTGARLRGVPGVQRVIGHPTLSGVAGYAAGIVVHYFLSRRFVFDAARSPKAAHRRVRQNLSASGLVGLVVTAGVIAVATASFGLAPIAAKVLACRRELHRRFPHPQVHRLRFDMRGSVREAGLSGSTGRTRWLLIG